MGSWVWCKAPLEHLLLSSNPAVDTSHASLLSHPHSPPSWLMISLSFDVLMKSLRLSWMAGPLLANYSIKCKWKKNVTGVICLVNISHQGFTVFFSMWIHNRRWVKWHRLTHKKMHVNKMAQNAVFMVLIFSCITRSQNFYNSYQW